MKAVNPNSAIEAQIKATTDRLKQGVYVGYWIDEIALKEIFRFSDTTITNYRKRGLLRYKKWGGRLFFDLAHILCSLEVGCHQPGTNPSVKGRQG